ncbi:MAG: hypothetical protein GY787_22485 [Alteromonadales bacterium]|nr:hypothetical protein [Alteromonadales bacterium]
MDTLVLRISSKQTGKRTFKQTIENKEAQGFALSNAQRELAFSGCKLILVDQHAGSTATAVIDSVAELETEKGCFDISFSNLNIKKHYLDVKFPKGYDAHKGCTLVKWDDYYIFS